MIDAPINETLPSSTGGAAVISVPTLPGSALKDFAVQARGSVDMLISNTDTLTTAGTMTTYYTIKSGTSVALSQVLAPDSDIFYVLSGGAADVVEILPLRK